MTATMTGTDALLTARKIGNAILTTPRNASQMEVSPADLTAVGSGTFTAYRDGRTCRLTVELIETWDGE